MYIYDVVYSLLTRTRDFPIDCITFVESYTRISHTYISRRKMARVARPQRLTPWYIVYVSRRAYVVWGTCRPRSALLLSAALPPLSYTWSIVNFSPLPTSAPTFSALHHPLSPSFPKGSRQRPRQSLSLYLGALRIHRMTGNVSSQDTFVILFLVLDGTIVVGFQNEEYQSYSWQEKIKFEANNFHCLNSLKFDPGFTRVLASSNTFLLLYK